MSEVQQENVIVRLVNGKPTVIIDTDSKFDREKFLSSLADLDNQETPVFKSDLERGNFVAVLCAAFGFSTEDINSKLPLAETGEQLLQETDKQNRLLSKTATLNEVATNSIKLDSGGNDSAAEDRISSFFMGGLESADDEVEDGDE